MSASTGLQQHREGLTTSQHDWTMVEAGKLVANQNVVIIDSNASVEDACEVLLKNKVSSAPVYDGQHKLYVGMFDYSDLMTYILLALRKMEVPPEDQTVHMRDLIQKTTMSQNVPVKLAAVAVMDSAGDLTGILSQSSTLDYLMRHLSEFPQLQPMMQQTLQQCGLLTNTKVLSVKADDKVLDALITMSTHSVSSLAVLDDQGILLGNISMTDIQYIMRNLKASWLWLSSFQFMSKIRLERGVETGEDQYPVLDVNSKSTFGYTLSKLQATKVHRLWVVNDSGAVVGVVSLTDVFRILGTLVAP
ncbi:cell separation during budding [Lunasporangiospora selenospora]|uniref:Cell separation during budding n=1 Tax=Lunasporangiospora selenospora TaxID=979761 RepID=A0A9P6FSS9_9FUNG|nr:cell separation during budding [Lunasporangiospora selenospora]